MSAIMPYYGIMRCKDTQNNGEKRYLLLKLIDFRKRLLIFRTLILFVYQKHITLRQKERI